MSLVIVLVLLVSLGFLSLTKAQKHYLTNQYAYDLFQLMAITAAFQKHGVTINSIIQTQGARMDSHANFQTFSLQTSLVSSLASGSYTYHDKNGYYSEFGIH